MQHTCPPFLYYVRERRGIIVLQVTFHRSLCCWYLNTNESLGILGDVLDWFNWFRAAGRCLACLFIGNTVTCTDDLWNATCNRNLPSVKSYNRLKLARQWSYLFTFVLPSTVTTEADQTYQEWDDLPVERQRALKLYSSNKISSVASYERITYLTFTFTIFLKV